MHLTILLKISLIIGSNLVLSVETSIISNISERNKVYLVKFAYGQYHKIPSKRG